MTSNQPPLWLLIDGTNSAYRDFHAAGADRVGRLTRDRMEAFVAHWRPARIVAAFDDGPSFRSELYPDYKAGRKRPEGIDRAIDDAKAAYIHHAIDVLSVERYEADDLIATLARRAVAADARAAVYSADKDLHQLIREGSVAQLVKCTRDGAKLDPTWLNDSGLFVRYGVRPKQWIDYRILTGDPSDNLPGVAGVGPETAAQLLRQCGSLNAFYAAPFKTTIARRYITRIINHKRQIPLLRRLSTLCADVPLPEGWEE